MAHLTSPPPSSLFLFAGTACPGRVVRISHVYRVALMTCRALRPRGCPTPLPKSRCRVMSSGSAKSSTIPQQILYGALSLQPKGLRPITSLSTLDPHGYPYRPKTRYQVRWVPASWAALSAASKTAPRGAQLVEERVTPTPPHLEPIVPDSGNRLRTEPFAWLYESDPIGSHGLPSLQLVKARSQRILIEQVHQTIKPF